jgi:hypothetical protein
MNAAPLTAAVVRRCFAEAIKGHRLTLPDDEACEWVAKSVSEEAVRVGTKINNPTLGTAEKHARLFLKHLPPAHNAVAVRFHAFKAFHPDVGAEENPHFAAMVEFALAEQAVTALLERYGAEKPRTNTWHDLANWIANCGVRAWDKPVGKAMDVNPEAPLCAFVHQVLVAVGIDPGRATVADALRFRLGPISRDPWRHKKTGRTRSR